MCFNTLSASTSITFLFSASLFLSELGVIEPVGRKDAVGKPILFGTTDEFLKRFQISSLDELPDYDELINKIQLIRGTDSDSGYLYKKDVYVEEGEENKEVAVTANVIPDKIEENVESPEEDFDLPPIEDEEIPDFLQGEDVEKI